MDDRERVAQLIGRQPQGAFDVVVRDDMGDPVVVRNAPFLDNGTPMPTRYYLVGSAHVRAVSRLEAAGGVRDAESQIDADEIAAAHERYAAERDAEISDDHDGPRPYGGVGGTRTGVKCLHAHLAYHLAGGDDPVGRWTLAHLEPELNPSAARGTTNPQPGGLTVRIGDRSCVVLVTGGDSFDVPVGPVSLAETTLCEHDPPAAADLTNALGFVHDHLDDLLIESPTIAATPSVVVVGDHAVAMARVEIGGDTIPDDYTLGRADAEEVFRTLAVESTADRRHNPGLDEGHVVSIVGTCCVILGLMRRLELQQLQIAAPVGGGR